MYQAEYCGINAFLVGTARMLCSDEHIRQVRGNVCYELPEPYMFKITNPLAREVTIPVRKWNRTLPYAESLWIASGRNDMHFITRYLERMMDFSDDGKFMRGGYGPRFRHYNGSRTDYQISETALENRDSGIDMFQYIVECFHKDSNTRRAIITIGDNNKDCFDTHMLLKDTKDIPCTRELHFIKQADSNKLDLIVTMRSNDFIWGASAVNIFNYTFMQEYMSAILGMEIGDYYHVAENFHYYERHKELVKALAELNDVEEHPIILEKKFSSLQEFDDLLVCLSKAEQRMWKDTSHQRIEFKDQFFQHWYDVIYKYGKSYMAK